MDEQERRSYECAKNDIQKLMTQNDGLRKRIAQLKGNIGELEEEIRNRNAEGDALTQTVKMIMSGDVAEIQLTFRMKRYFDE